MKRLAKLWRILKAAWGMFWESGSKTPIRMPALAWQYNFEADSTLRNMILTGGLGRIIAAISEQEIADHQEYLEQCVYSERHAEALRTEQTIRMFRNLLPLFTEYANRFKGSEEKKSA